MTKGIDSKERAIGIKKITEMKGLGTKKHRPKQTLSRGKM